MRTEIDLITEQLQDAYTGEPWFGRNVKQLLAEVDQEAAFVRPNNGHSILELLWHMVTWREFTIHCLQPTSVYSLKHFEDLDWREIDHNHESLWSEGLKRLDETQSLLVSLLQQQDDSILEKNVNERTYNYRKLLTGIIQHDIYHLGQIAYITKYLRNS